MIWRLPVPLEVSRWPYRRPFYVILHHQVLTTTSPARTPWVALISCDSNSTDVNAANENILTRAAQLGAVAAASLVHTALLITALMITWMHRYSTLQSSRHAISSNPSRIPPSLNGRLMSTLSAIHRLPCTCSPFSTA